MTEEEAAHIILTGVRELPCSHCKWPENVIHCQHCLNTGWVDNEEYWDACEFLGEGKIPIEDEIMLSVIKGSNWKMKT